MKDIAIIKKTRLPIVVAITEEEQERGLMYQPWPPPAMAFPFDTLEERKFWMRNTISPLDIIFCRANEIIAIYQGEPLSIDLVGPDDPVDLVIELPAGTAKSNGFSVGDFVDIKYSIETMGKKFGYKLTAQSA